MLELLTSMASALILGLPLNVFDTQCHCYSTAQSDTKPITHIGEIEFTC